MQQKAVYFLLLSFNIHVHEVVRISRFYMTIGNACEDDVFSVVPCNGVVWRPCSRWWTPCCQMISDPMKNLIGSSCFLNIRHSDLFPCSFYNVAGSHPKTKRNGSLRQQDREIEAWFDFKAGSSFCVKVYLMWRNWNRNYKHQARAMLSLCVINGYKSELFNIRPVTLASLIVASRSRGCRTLLYCK